MVCASCTSKAIYYNKSFNPPVYFGKHVVRPGETLYSIARRYGRELSELARANKILSPYVIQPGQRIDLERDTVSRQEHAAASGSSERNRKNVTKGKGTVAKSKKVTKKQKHKKVYAVDWQWPNVGPILAKYSRNAKVYGGKGSRGALNQGIDISGSLGSPVFAAAEGEVVYVGSGLLGYGNLVIINHNETYLSAYAHNNRVIVREGQKISKGQKVAEMGFSEKNKVLLHFQIRRNGQPVDPLKYLPSR